MRMEVNTGASADIIIMETYQENRCKLNKFMPVNIQLRTYSEDVIKPIGKHDGELVYDNQNLNISLIVADTKEPNLLGRDILRLLRLNWEIWFDINNIREIATTKKKLKEILSEYNVVFMSDLGTLKCVEGESTANADCEPNFFGPDCEPKRFRSIICS